MNTSYTRLVSASGCFAFSTISTCNSITLLVIASKVLGKILIERLKSGADKRLRAEQAGFLQGRSTTEQLFILCYIIEQSYEWQTPLVVNVIDFEKAFDSLHRPSLWDIMKAYGIPGKIIRIVQLLYQDSECAVLDGGQTSEWFKVETGVKQGCVMSGFLFLLAIDWIMCETTKQANTGIRWRFMDQTEDLDFADDIALISTTQNQMQNKDTCMDNKLSKAKAAFRKLKRIWGSKQYNRRTKIRLFNTLVKPVLLYESETWKTNVQDNRKLDSFQSQCLKRSLGIFWPCIVSIDELNERTGCSRMSVEVKRRRWRFLGHVLWMPREHHCATALTWTPMGKRKVGRPKTTWRRTVEKERAMAGWKSWEEVRALAKDRDKWKKSSAALCAA